MEPSRKRQRGGLPLRDNDGDAANHNHQDRTVDQEEHRQEHARGSTDSPLFLSRHTSEEPRIPADGETSNRKPKSKAPSFLDDDDEETFLKMGFRSATAAMDTTLTPQPAASSSTQQRLTQPRKGMRFPFCNLEILTREEAMKALAPFSKSEHLRKTPLSEVPKTQLKQSASTRVIKPPREPNEALKRYTTSLYVRYDPQRNNVGPVAGKFNMGFRIYDAYTLVVDPSMAIGNLPTTGVRVDDFLAGKLLMSDYSSKVLHQAWPAEFDHNGLIRATRIPLGHAAKQWRQVGDTDIDGKVIQSGQEGWYYDWWRGLHCLMDKEGYDAGMYLVRPSWKKFLCEGMTFKIGCKSIVQLPTGDPNDPTPGL
ncbi:MAG: hypothetical protein Q9221_007338 [Calogaya cf. arnoldii]